MKWFAILAVLSVALAGCGGKGGDDPPIDPTLKDPSQLDKGRGAIAGLLLDDALRPIVGAVVLLEQTGETNRSNANGEFYFLDLEPGTYRLRVQSDGHEANPVTSVVKEGEYTDQRILARRIVNDSGSIITREYSVFVPCAASVPVSSLTFDCLVDLSGDTFRTGFVSDLRETAGITHVVTELRTNVEASPDQGAFKVVVREEGDGDYYASQFIVQGDYMRLVMTMGQRSPDDTEDRNVNWTNDKSMETMFFPQGSFKAETQTLMDASCDAGGLCGESRGAGVQMGIRARFVQSVFIGEPTVDIDGYHAL